jgi:hypothetical protein
MDNALIAFKKMFGVAHTSPNKALVANEDFGTGFSVKASSLFGQTIPTVSVGEAPYTLTNGIVERVRLLLRPIPGTETTGGTNAGVHGFSAELPSDYFTAVRTGTGSNFRPIATPPAPPAWGWAPGTKLVDTQGGIQIVPAALGGSTFGVTLYDQQMRVIEPLAANSWILYEYGGIIYQENPPASVANPVGDSSFNPGFLDCWVYIGLMQSEVSGGVTTSRMSQIAPDNTPHGGGWPGVGSVYTAIGSDIGSWATDFRLVRFSLDVYRLAGLEVFEMPDGWSGVWDNDSKNITITHSVQNLVPVLAGFTPMDAPGDVAYPSYACPYTTIRTVTAPVGKNGEDVVVSAVAERSYQLWSPKISSDLTLNPITTFEIRNVTADRVRFLVLMTTLPTSNASSSSSSSFSSSSYSSSSSSESLYEYSSSSSYYESSSSEG